MAIGIHTVYVSQVSKTIYRKNTISGHEWSEIVLINKWECSGGGFVTSVFNSRKKAEKEKDLRIGMLKRFPYLIILPIVREKRGVCHKCNKYRHFQTNKIVSVH